VERNARWHGDECVNLLAPEAPMSPTVRHLLSAEVGQRAAEGHIGPANRWFAGTRYIDEIEALCVELLKRVFRARYADHRHDQDCFPVEAGDPARAPQGNPQP
jgi:glycine hydroxymethyltransferase